MYIHIILLGTSYMMLSKCEAKNKLQEALIKPRSKMELRLDEDIIQWVASTAALAVGGGQCHEAQKACLVDIFNNVSLRLEALYL
jgi:hypothetical protein